VFDFVDLFAGVGGFHAALSSVGGRGVQAAEIDSKAASVYERNWGLKPVRDVRWLSEDPSGRVPAHSVLTGGFPCQPFSKSGRQLGIAEDRGTLFHDILAILEAKTPPVVMLENVRNIAGPRQEDAWNGVINGLRAVGYKVSNVPAVMSPHLLSPQDGGAAQVRDRVYIMGVWVGPERATDEKHVEPVLRKGPQNGWDPTRWSIEDHVLLPEHLGAERQAYALSSDEVLWIDTWNELLGRLGNHVQLPGFPMWEMSWRGRPEPGYANMPPWKQRFVDQNRRFYADNRTAIDSWRRSNPQLQDFPLSRRKLEWQARGSDSRDLWKQLLQLRPSGIRVKQPTWAPALVAMNQTSIYGPARRRLTPMETARLQGFDPDTFSFGDQARSLSYKQMGNAVNVGTARYVFTKFVRDNANDIAKCDEPGRAILSAMGVEAELTR
jgi:DNA (cytosine-5)-methyltransferase 1